MWCVVFAEARCESGESVSVEAGTGSSTLSGVLFFFFQAEDGIRDDLVTGVQTCALPIYVFSFRCDPGAMKERNEKKKHHAKKGRRGPRHFFEEDTGSSRNECDANKVRDRKSVV